jgi:hypothetical protein
MPPIAAELRALTARTPLSALVGKGAVVALALALAGCAQAEPLQSAPVLPVPEPISAPPVPAAVSEAVVPDSGALLLAALAKDGLRFDDNEAVVEVARSVCGALERGASNSEIAAVLVGELPLDDIQAQLFIAASARDP